MKDLYVTKSLTIQAPAQKVWRVLTDSHYTDQWTPEFSGIEDPLTIESDWQLGSHAKWKNKKGEVFVDGTVTEHQPQKSLRFTVMTTDENPGNDEPTSIAYSLREENANTTVLSVKQGDFAKITGGQEHHDYMLGVWDRILARIKKLAEE